jgi:hypothetical protein
MVDPFDGGISEKPAAAGSSHKILPIRFCCQRGWPRIACGTGSVFIG